MSLEGNPCKGAEMKRRVSLGCTFWRRQTQGHRDREKEGETGKEGERNKAVREKLRGGQTGEKAEAGRREGSWMN